MEEKPIYWLQPESTQLGKWQRQIKEVTGSHSFCVLPWIHLATRPNGDMRLCCVANASGADSGDYTVGLVKEDDGKAINFANSLPQDVFNNEYMRDIRKTMLQGKVPKTCVKCFEEEQNGVSSKRIWETGVWHFEENIDIKELIANTVDGEVPYKLRYLDLRLGNTCNLKCVMCSPHDSSLWVKDHQKIIPIVQSSLIKNQIAWEPFNNVWHENPEFLKQIYEQIPNIKQLYFAGGEPLIIKEHRYILEEVIKQGYANQITLRYNTNGTIITDEILSLWKHFKKVKVGLSIDGIGKRIEYIRYPIDFAQLEQNLIKLDNTPDNIQINLAFAVQILNIKHVPDFIKWKVNSKFKKINQSIDAGKNVTGGGLASVHLVWMPTWLNLRVLPKEDKKEIRLLFEDLKIWLQENYTQSDDFWIHNPYGWKRWEGLLDYMDSEDQTHLLPDFIEYITVLDKQRNTVFSEVFPELSHLIP